VKGDQMKYNELVKRLQGVVDELVDHRDPEFDADADFDPTIDHELKELLQDLRPDWFHLDESDESDEDVLPHPSGCGCYFCGGAG